MMRRCIVNKCFNSDQVILCHRFPKNRRMAQKWQASLDLTDCPLEALVSKFAVCCQHFDSTDYRNSASNSLNANAVPKLKATNPRPYEVVRTKSAPLEPPQPSAKCEEKHNSSDSSIELVNRDDNDVDVDVVEIDVSEDIFIVNRDLKSSDPMLRSIDGTDFTMLEAGLTPYMPTIDENKSEAGTVESSTFVLDSTSNSGHSSEPRMGSTESDVEVLISEAIFDSHYAETEQAKARKEKKAETNECAVIPCVTDYAQMDRFQLIEIIKNQSMKIEELESKLDEFKSAQEELFIQFNVFRDTVCGTPM